MISSTTITRNHPLQIKATLNQININQTSPETSPTSLSLINHSNPHHNLRHCPLPRSHHTDLVTTTTCTGPNPKPSLLHQQQPNQHRNQQINKPPPKPNPNTANPCATLRRLSNHRGLTPHNPAKLDVSVTSEPCINHTSNIQPPRAPWWPPIMSIHQTPRPAGSFVPYFKISSLSFS